jgi:hypothetical protein
MVYNAETPTPAGGTAGADLTQPNLSRGSAMAVFQSSTRARAPARFFAPDFPCSAAELRRQYDAWIAARVALGAS